MIDKENEYDSYLNIRTTGRDDSNADLVNYPYEATPYMVLECIVDSGYLSKKNTLLDYGCGKGRVDFFLSSQTKCKSIGIEYDKRLFDRAISNKETAISKNRTEFYNANAMNYIVKDTIDRVYYFNPFCVEILKETLYQLRESLKRNKRKILLFFYYPSTQYIDTLESMAFLTCKEEIDTKHLYNNEDSRERIVIYEMGE